MNEIIYLPDGITILGSSPEHFEKSASIFEGMSDNIPDAGDSKYYFSKKVQKEFQ